MNAKTPRDEMGEAAREMSPARSWRSGRCFLVSLCVFLLAGAAPAMALAVELRSTEDIIARADASDETKAAMASLVEQAQEAGLPVEPLLAKFLEGVSKGVAEARILAAVRAVEARLGRAKVALDGGVRSGAAGPLSDADVSRVGAGLSAGVPIEQVMLLSEAAADANAPISRVSAAVATLERLRTMGVYEESAAEALATAISAGYLESDLRRMAEDYRRHAEAGGDESSFFQAAAQGWGQGDLWNHGLGHDAAGRIESGRLPDEAGGGEAMVPGTDRLARDNDDESDLYDGDRSRPYDDRIPEIPEEDDEELRQDPPEPPSGP